MNQLDRSGIDDSAFDRARNETIRYHEELYATTALGTPHTWLARPQPFVLDAIDRVTTSRPVVAYDLGAGIGRHAVPMAERLHPDSTIVAVDLLPAALASLAKSVSTISPIGLRTVAADLATFEFDATADLVVAFSAIEHLPDLESINRLLGRIAGALAPGGLVVVGMVCDRYEVTANGEHRPALLESAITSDEASAALRAAFGRLNIIRDQRSPATVRESRDGQDYLLASTLLSFVAQRS